MFNKNVLKIIVKKKTIFDESDYKINLITIFKLGKGSFE